MKIYAHRGGSITSVENTMEAFQKALEFGISGFECDVQLTADGEPIIFHDDDLKRLTGVSGRVAKTRYKEICARRVKGKHPIPHLSELLNFATQHCEIGCYLDLHNPSQQLIEVLAEALSGSSLLKNCYILGFYSEAGRYFRWLRKNYPDISIALMPEMPWGILRKVQDLGAQAISIGWQDLGTQFLFRTGCLFSDLKSEIQHVKEAGIEVAGGIANTEGEIQWLLNQGVTGIWTDDLALAVQVKNQETV